MNYSLIESTLQQIVPRLYSFSYALMGNEKAASNLVFDTLYLIKKDEKIISFFKEFEKETDQVKLIEYPTLIKIRCYRILYLMAEKEFSNKPHNKKNFRDNQAHYSAFFGLEFIDRAILFLKYREHYDHNDMSEVFSMDNTQMITLLVTSKNHLSEVVSI